ncbi:hypothetical protein ACFLY6_00605 [Candidatus Dependentiae bacterium]
MKKVLKTLLAAVMLLSTVAKAKKPENFTGKFITQEELTEVFRRCSLANPNSENRRKTAEAFLAKAEKTVSKAEYIAEKDAEKGYKKRSKNIAKRAKTLKDACQGLRRNKKLETGRFTDEELLKFMADHNQLVDLIELGIFSMTLRGIGSCASGTGSLVSKYPKIVISTLALSGAFFLGAFCQNKYSKHAPFKYFKN